MTKDGSAGRGTIANLANGQNIHLLVLLKNHFTTRPLVEAPTITVTQTIRQVVLIRVMIADIEEQVAVDQRVVVGGIYLDGKINPVAVATEEDKVSEEDN